METNLAAMMLLLLRLPGFYVAVSDKSGGRAWTEQVSAWIFFHARPTLKFSSTKESKASLPVRRNFFLPEVCAAPEVSLRLWSSTTFVYVEPTMHWGPKIIKKPSIASFLEHNRASKSLITGRASNCQATSL